MAKASYNPCSEIYYKDSCRPLFRNFKILTVPCLYIFSCIVFLKENDCHLETNSSIHTHDTRNKDALRNVKHKLNIFSKGPLYMGCKLYNNLPEALKSISSRPDVFKDKLKLFLIENSFYTIEEYYMFNRN